MIGSGEFGNVNKGVWHLPGGVATRDVAIKTLRGGTEEEQKVKFLQEAAINGQFHHQNIVKLYGVVTLGEPVSGLFLTAAVIQRSFCAVK